MTRKTGVCFILFLAFLTFTGLQFSFAGEWNSYVNERFGFRFDYPASLKPGRIPPNGAGLNFSDGKFSVTAQGHFLNGKTLEDFYREALNSYGAEITYKVNRPTWFVVSAEQNNGFVVYKKFHVKGGNWAQFTATYPASLSAKYDPVIERMAKGFVPFLEGKNYDRVP
jgi:hypothetical protein